jgi:hypothetical protein
MRRKLRWFFLAFVVLATGFALLQLTNPTRTNPAVVSDLMASNPPPPQIAAMLHAACYDCHSSETRWPWYSHIAPMSWLIASDVKEGREHLNLSDWPNDDPLRAAKRLDNMSDEIGSGEMPLKKYAQIHADARLTESQRKELTDWLDAEATRLKSMTGKEFQEYFQAQIFCRAMNGSALLSGIVATRQGGLKFPKFLDLVPKLLKSR